MPKRKKVGGFTEQGVNKWIEYIKQMKAKKGPYYERWKEAMRKWLEKELKRK